MDAQPFPPMPDLARNPPGAPGDPALTHKAPRHAKLTAKAYNELQRFARYCVLKSSEKWLVGHKVCHR